MIVGLPYLKLQEKLQKGELKATEVLKAYQRKVNACLRDSFYPQSLSVTPDPIICPSSALSLSLSLSVCLSCY